MIRVLARSIRQYKKASILTPLLVTVEVILECAIPFLIANLVNEMQAGCSMSVIAQYGVALIAMSIISLVFGGAAGATCATASAGFARNLRKDMFYKIQDYSFENIDKFSVSSLVTRLTTDITNVQMAYMMIIRVAIRCPLMLICHGICHGRPSGNDFPVYDSAFGHRIVLGYPCGDTAVPPCIPQIRCTE